jgi:hypothetical protein
MIQGGLVPNWGPNVYRTVTTGDLKTVSGVPKRCACFLNFTNTDSAAQTVVFQGGDSVNVTKTLPPGADILYYGDFSTLGTTGTGVTVVAGWVDDASVQKNA